LFDDDDDDNDDDDDDNDDDEDDDDTVNKICGDCTTSSPSPSTLNIVPPLGIKIILGYT